MCHILGSYCESSIIVYFQKSYLCNTVQGSTKKIWRTVFFLLPTNFLFQSKCEEKVKLALCFWQSVQMLETKLNQKHWVHQINQKKNVCSLISHIFLASPNLVLLTVCLYLIHPHSLNIILNHKKCND